MTSSIEPRDTYLDDATYERLKSTLAELVAEPFAKCGSDAATEVIFALGEIGGIWPEHIRGDVEALA